MTLVVAWLWQGMAIAGATALLLRCSRRLSAATRHAIWWLALVSVAILPAGYLARSLAQTDAPRGASAVPVAGTVVQLPAAPDWFAAALALGWVVMALVGYIRIAQSVRAVYRLKRASVPLDPERAARLGMWSAARSTRFGPRPALRVSDAVRGASALGLGRPVILVSSALAALDDDQLDAIVMHEHAHIARFDDWTQLAQAIIAATFAMHPAVWFIGRRIHLEREAACDDLVIARGSAARDYARSLVEVAAAACFREWSAVAIPGAAGSHSVLRSRVRRLLDPSVSRDSRMATPAIIACATVMALAVGVSARTPAVVVFVDRTFAEPPVMALARPGTAPAAASPLPALATGRVATARQARRAPPRPAGLTSPTTAANAPRAADQMPASAILELPPLSAIQAAARVGAGRLDATLRLDPARFTPGVSDTTAPPGSPGPWTTAARSATAVGQVGGRAGASIGRFFGRAGKAIAGSF